MQAAERKRPKEERELINQLRMFARFLVQEDFDAFIEGLASTPRTSFNGSID